jgi:hypothetical protein
MMSCMEAKLIGPDVVPRKNTYVGLFMVTLATLMYEILLTRIFSVTMWYHFAFVAISVAMFGMTAGAILVYLLHEYFTQERAKHHLALSSLLFAVSIVVSFLTHLSIPFVIPKSIGDLYSLGFLYSIALTYVVISVPFVFSGVCVSLALTKFPRQVSKLYAADLSGAAVGCILLICTLRITDGPTAVFVVAFLISIGSVLFAAEAHSKNLMQIGIVCSFLLASFVASHMVLVNKQLPLLRLMWVKGRLEDRPLYENWNSFSRIRVTGNPDKPEDPFGWGLSSTYPSDQQVRQLHMNIDAVAYTPLTAFDGDLNHLEYLKYDITALAHYLRPDSSVLVVGTGGGRDILSALVFEQKSVLGVEINNEIVKAVNKRFGDFTGHLDRNPRVTFINDEARSYIARQKDKFDIIQVSFVDTWAATAAGAFVLTENSLYTVEAWKILLEHLTPNGVLTFSRWYFRDRPSEIYRLTALASTSLVQLGVKNPRGHIVIVRCIRPTQSTGRPVGVGTMLVSTKPFSDKDLNTIEAIANEMQFDIVLSPRFSVDSNFTTIASGKELDTVINFSLNVSPPTDNNPFFFHMLRFRDVFNRGLWEEVASRSNLIAVSVLGFLLIIVVGLTLLCFIVPLVITTKTAIRTETLPLFIFFAAIGFGFMFVEISQMQRLIIFLGHPTYGLSVVLFALLLSSGLGSYSTRKITDIGAGVVNPAIVYLLGLLCMLGVFGKFTPYITSLFQGSATMLRILVAIATLFPLGLFMGMPFPIGMKIASVRSASLTPWLWGINGATSVCASVLAVAIGLGSGISGSFWTGFSCYVAAFIAFIWGSRGKG